MFERLAVAAGLEFLGVAQGTGLVKMLVAAAMIEMIMGVDDIVDVGGFEAELGKLPRNALRGVLDRLLEGQYPHHVVEVVAGVEDIAAVGVLDEHAVAGKLDFTAGTAVPEGVIAVDHQRAAVEQMNLCVAHKPLTSTRLKVAVPSSPLHLGGAATNVIRARTWRASHIGSTFSLPSTISVRTVSISDQTLSGMYFECSRRT